MPLTRRRLLMLGPAVGAALAGGAIRPAVASAEDDGTDIVEALIDGVATESDRIRLDLPAVFPNGSTVPMSLSVDTAMSAADHVRRVRVFAPRNPIVEIVSFSFEPVVGVPKVSTRIRLAGPQHVVAVAEMNDGAMLLAKRFVDVATNGCAEH